MSEKRFELVSVCGDFGIIDTITDEVWFFETYESVVKVVDLLNEQQATIITLKRRLEKINGGYGLLTHRNGLTANEWLIESQERELEKKNEQISDWIERHSKDIEKISEQQNTISQLEEENEQLKKRLEHYKEVEAMNGDGKNE